MANQGNKTNWRKQDYLRKTRLIKESKGRLSTRSPLICTYKRRREKKDKTHKNSKRMQFLIEDKGKKKEKVI